MNANFDRLLAFAITFALTSVEAFAAANSVPAAPSKVVACVAANSICVALAAEPTDKGAARMGYRWGGEDIEPPQSMVSQLVVTVKGDDVFVPLSAYADLGSPRTIEIRTTSRGFELVVNGGDASSAYRALLVFEGRLLTRRKVQHREFPREAWEETRYKFNSLKN